jgi:GNAT superfamily N-acetyltransferase
LSCNQARLESGGLTTCGVGANAARPFADAPDPIPCLLLGQLATDENWIGKGIGTGLLKHALQRCVTAARLIGGRALIVNAVDVEAAAFWARRGFLPSKDDPLILFRSIADIAASFR